MISSPMQKHNNNEAHHIIRPRAGAVSERYILCSPHNWISDREIRSFSTYSSVVRRVAAQEYKLQIIHHHRWTRS